MAGDAHWASVVLLAHFDGLDGGTTMIDATGRHTLTPRGSAALTATSGDYKFGVSGLSTPGSGGAVDTPGNSDFVFGTGDFTVECWFKTTDTDGGLIDFYTSGLNGWQIFMQAGKLQWYFSTSTLVVATPGTKNDGAWHHVAVARSGTTIKMFVDGVQEASATDANNYNSTIAQLSIGRQFAGSPSTTVDLIAKIDEVRITKGVARYTAAFTPATAAFHDGMGQVSGTVKSSGSAVARLLRAYRRDTGALVKEVYSGGSDPYFNNVVLLLHCDGTNGSTTFTDKSLAARAVTAVGDAKVSTAQSKFGGASALFDGSGDYLSIANHADFNFPGDFTVECFVRFATTAVAQALLSNYQDSPHGWSLELISGKIGFYPTGDGGTFLQSTSAINSNQWYHMAVSRTGSTMKLFVDGVEEDSDTISASITSTAILAVGRVGSVAINYHNGYIDEVRITKGVGRYTANFTPPADRLPESASGSLGDYSFYTPTTDELCIICLDDAAGTVENDLILRAVPA